MNRHLRLNATALCATLALMACGDSPGTEEVVTETAAMEEETQEVSLPPAPAAEPQEAEISAEGQAFLDENAAREDVRVTESGLQIEVLEEGTGESPDADDVIRIDYEISMPDGTVLDSSEANGAPIVVPSYEALQLPGLIEALPQMKEGGRWRIVMPPALGFGAQGLPGGLAGPGEPIIFEVGLVEVIDPENQERLDALRDEEMARMQARQEEMMAAFEAQAAENAEASQEFLAEVAAREGVSATETGLLYEVVEDTGEGESPTAADTVRVHYRGTLPTGEEFDSSYSRGQPATFPLGGVIPGWTEGLQLMDVGDTYRFYVPADLAYGERGTPGGQIGPNQALIFDVELLGIENSGGASDGE
jgi:FKBP-type peptidyl-prolyl cis-trans isomerase